MEQARILVVDDEMIIRTLLQDILTEAKFFVDIAASPNEALQKLHNDCYDLMISDIKMPGMSGIDLLKAAKRIDENLHIIMVTGHATADTAINALRFGAYDYVKKPFAIEELINVVERCLEHRRLQIENRCLLRELEAANSNLQEKVLITNQELDARSVELATLSDVGKVLGSVLDLEEILVIILHSTLEQTKTQTGVLGLCDENNILEIKKGVGLLQKIFENNNEILHTDWFLDNGNALLLNSFNDFPKLKNIFAGYEHNIHSLITVPMKIQHRTVGILMLASLDTNNYFTKDDLRLLDILSTQAAITVENANLYQNVQETYFATIQSLIISIEAKDPYTRGHSERVTRYAVSIAEALKLSEEEIKIIQDAGFLHDIGKIGISENIIGKTGKLTLEEYEIIKQHPVIGERIIAPIKFLQAVKSLVRHHHEWYDGTGYPDGLTGEEICLGARILAVADAFDALTSTRPYHKRSTIREAALEIQRGANKQFDPNIVEIFLDALKNNKFNLIK